MLKTDFSNLQNLDFTSFNKNFKEYKKKLLSRQQGFLNLGTQPQNIAKISEFAKLVEGKYEAIVILGIGGSMLGPQTILEAFTANLNLKVHCLDNIDPYQIKTLEKQITFSKTLFLIQTKSGTTPETLAQYFYFREIIEKSGLKPKEHFVFVTDPNNGYLREVAIKQNIPSFEIPENVGGRFSILTPVGLLISALIGLDIQKLLDGAQESLEQINNESDQSFKLAVSQYLLAKKGYNIAVLMPYSSRLRVFSNWYVQLLSESIGKKINLLNQEVRVGITPVPALGVTDQHSQMQLFKEGPKDKLLIFINLKNHGEIVEIPENQIDQDSIEYLKKVSFNKLLDAEFQGTRQSLIEEGVLNVTLTLEKLDEYSLGFLFMFFEKSVAFLGELFEINTFDQPGVERSKVLTREILARGE
jgi:glucose-6-phosphate isomerase